MPKEFSRSSRVGRLIRSELAELLQKELNTPGLGMVSLSEVDVSPDLRNAKVYFTFFGGSMDTAQVSAHLQDQAAFLRHQLARRLKLRIIPRLLFIHDHSLEEGSRLSALIDSANPDKTPK